MQFKLKHLAIALGLSIVLTSFVSLISTWYAVDDEVGELLYEDIQQQAALLGRLINQGHIEADELEEFLNSSFIDDDEDTFLIAIENVREGWYASNFKLPQQFGHRDDGLISRQHMGYNWHGYQISRGDLIIQLLRRSDLSDDLIGDVTEDILMPISIGVLLNLVFLLMLISFTTRPLGKLTKAISNRKATDLTPIKINGSIQEIANITHSLNTLMADVEDTLNREKHFTNNVAHELRTPLSTLKLELSLDDPDLVSINHEVARLIRVVEQLLTLARLESARWNNNFSKVDLGEILETSCHRLQHRFIAQNIQLQANIHSKTIAGDATLLGVLVDNLLLNILRHSQTATQVDASIESDNKRVFLRLKDNGIGIPKHLRERMLQPYSSLDRRSDGLGLGLAICQKIAEIHQAKLQFSDIENGLEVIIDFPN